MTEFRIPVIAGNWKMNLGPSRAREFVRSFVELHPPRTDRTVILIPPSISVGTVRAELADRDDVRLGLQNVFWEDSGAFTGEISAEMAAEAGAAFVLVGHSERRHVFGESIDDTQRKTEAVLRAGLTPIICVGETLQERRAGRAETVVRQQLAPVLDTALPDARTGCVIAYEPVWAIGTGETASATDAGTMHRMIRTEVRERFGDRAGMPILYGGSVKPANVAELLAEPAVDGVLVGGASLDPAGFAKICGTSA